MAVVSGPFKFTDIRTSPGVYQLRESPLSATLLVLEDGRTFYVNAGYISNFTDTIPEHLDGIWRTDETVEFALKSCKVTLPA